MADNKHKNQHMKTFGVLPVRNTVVFPGQTITLVVGREKSVRAIKQAIERPHALGSLIITVAQKQASVDDPTQEDLYTVGTVAEILDMTEVDYNTFSVTVRGIDRAELEFTTFDPYIMAKAKPIDEHEVSEHEIYSPAAKAKMDKLLDLAGELIQKASPMFNELKKDIDLLIQKDDDAELYDKLGYVIVGHMHAAVDAKQEILEEPDAGERLKEAIFMVMYELELLKIAQNISQQVKERLDRGQKEYFLREQLKAIQKELGEEDADEMEELRRKIAESGMPQVVREQAEKELKRLMRIPPMSPEHHVARTYLDWLIELPWDKTTEDNLDIERAAQILDEDHYGLEKVKKRILEYLAVRKLHPALKGPILALAGPPGVGKTSLGKSIARALGRKFIRISLGGVRDEAEIRGHRRTYIGALPGRIIQGIRRVGVKNPVFMLDEVDKLGADFRGDPSFALLEALDPEQNNQFSDHYIEVPFDLSQVMFVCTANVIDTIPPALKDRMEIIEIPGYTSHEKLHIAKKFLIPQRIEANGLKPSQISFKDEAIYYIIDRYTREAGVRNLNREIDSICRAVACRVATGKAKRKTTITKRQVEEILGPPKFELDVAERVSIPGVATGLAWTPHGGDIIFVEATILEAGKGELKLTGHLGDVMKESALAALSYLRANASRLGIEAEMFTKYDFHIHVPAGAIPKDGPSAGVTILSALTSVMKNKPIHSDMAMTGEITLRGKVLTVGGIKEKVLAAHRAGLRKVLMPASNKKDLYDIPEDIKNDMEFIFVSTMDEVLKKSLGLTIKKKS